MKLLPRDFQRMGIGVPKNLATQVLSLFRRNRSTPNLFLLASCSDSAEYKAFINLNSAKMIENALFEVDLLNRGETFDLPGYCAVCGHFVSFRCDYQHCNFDSQNNRVLNWRERLVCPLCGLNNRMRAALYFLISSIRRSDSIYLTEQATPLFRAISQRHRNTVGSEFLRDGTARGSKNAAGLRHEDVTSLSFADASFDLIGTFDVLEHVPDYGRALNEFYRCLRPGGKLLISIPFYVDRDDTLVRAALRPNGTVEHYYPPEYHGDPLSATGILCFYHFGWDFLEAMCEAGFIEQALSFYWSKELAHLGGNQFIISGLKKRP